MTKHYDPILIEDDDDLTTSKPASLRRSLSSASSTSSHTMRADSPDVDIVQQLARTDIKPSRNPQECEGTSSQEAIKKRSPSELEEEIRPSSRESHFVHKKLKKSSQNDSSSEVIDLEKDESEISPQNEAAQVPIDIDAIELQLEEDIFQEHQPFESQKSKRLPARRNPPISLPFVEVGDCKWEDSFLKAGKTVELKDGSFLQIKAVVQNLENDTFTLRGLKLKRTTQLEEHHGILRRNLNELVFIFEVDLDDPRNYLEQSVIEVALEDVVRIRRLICTNCPFPWFRFDEELLETDAPKEIVKKAIKDSEVLVARHKFTTKFTDARTRLENAKKPNNFSRVQLESLSFEECTQDHGMPASDQRSSWHGITRLGGSGVKSAARPGQHASQPSSSEKQRAPVVILDKKDDCDLHVQHLHAKTAFKLPRPNSKVAQMYTYGDTFSGGGGSMRGASLAGLKPLFGTDFKSVCCETLHANFPQVKIYEKWAHHFATMRGDLYVDILHLSPPCQFFSPNHTHPGQDDEMNFASCFAVEELIKKTRPRIATLEQTFGILHSRFRPAYNALIKMFVDTGYSVSWQVVHFADFGLAQSRKRLIIVAAGPGETLPEFPATTHSKNGGKGLKPWSSVHEVLHKIPRNATQHDVRAAAARPRASWHAWDDSSIVRCITTNGGDYNCHPSGKRSFTIRELAALQGFPHEHCFAGTATAMTRQIGNAVPPAFAKILFESIRKDLERVDSLAKAREDNH